MAPPVLSVIHYLYILFAFDKNHQHNLDLCFQHAAVLSDESYIDRNIPYRTSDDVDDNSDSVGFDLI